jgi:hypothetical protein
MRVSAQLLPAIQIPLCLFQTFEAHPFEWRLFGVANARFNPALSIWIFYITRKSDGAVVLEQIAIQRIERRIVDIGREENGNYYFLPHTTCHTRYCESERLVEKCLDRRG